MLPKPQVPAEDRVRLRLGLVVEEFFELLDAIGVNTSYAKEVVRNEIDASLSRGTDQVNVVGVADACADIDYVVEGLRLEFGINGEPVADEVHRSNMMKFKRDNSGCGMHYFLEPDGHCTCKWVPVRVREDGKILKPDDWKPPDIIGVLKKQGFEP